MQATPNTLAHIDICCLKLQNTSFPTCTVKIPLWPQEMKTVSRSGMFQSIENIAYAVSQLRDNGISICITLQAADGIGLPAPDVMKSVASVIREVDCVHIASMTSTSWQPQGWGPSQGSKVGMEAAAGALHIRCTGTSPLQEGKHCLGGQLHTTQEAGRPDQGKVP